MVIVAVVGAAHVEGIARRWREKSAKELASCDTQ
jgi:pheromone shutdown protein TraB